MKNVQAPNFKLLDQDGKETTLSQFLGTWIVLYFYPKDDTPGCTKEACNFRDTFAQLEKLGATIIGISKDSVSSHKKFATKYNLNFPLLSDPDHSTIEAYSAWGEKKFMGRLFLGILRKTYVINPSGQIVKIFEKVNPTIHAGEIIDYLKQNLTN